jgi:predicted kinase
LRSRITQRNAAKNDPSDADENVMLRQLETMDPFAPEEAAYLLRVDTRAADALSQTLQHVRRQLRPS